MFKNQRCLPNHLWVSPLGGSKLIHLVYCPYLLRTWIKVEFLSLIPYVPLLEPPVVPMPGPRRYQTRTRLHSIPKRADRIGSSALSDAQMLTGAEYKGAIACVSGCAVLCSVIQGSGVGSSTATGMVGAAPMMMSKAKLVVVLPQWQVGLCWTSDSQFHRAIEGFDVEHAAVVFMRERHDGAKSACGVERSLSRIVICVVSCKSQGIEAFHGQNVLAST